MTAQSPPLHTHLEDENPAAENVESHENKHGLLQDVQELGKTAIDRLYKSDPVFEQKYRYFQSVTDALPNGPIKNITERLVSAMKIADVGNVFAHKRDELTLQLLGLVTGIGGFFKPELHIVHKPIEAAEFLRKIVDRATESAFYVSSKVAPKIIKSEFVTGGIRTVDNILRTFLKLPKVRPA